MNKNVNQKMITYLQVVRGHNPFILCTFNKLLAKQVIDYI